MPRPVIQSYKKVINYAPASQTTSLVVKGLSQGGDSVAAGQTGPTDIAVPSGSVIKFFEIQYSCTNLLSSQLIIHCCIELLHSGQSFVNPNVVGGSPKRNQVHFQQMFGVGLNQNSNHIFRFKIPKRFQRVRDGDVWNFLSLGSTAHSDCAQVIYKFYR